jgi:hypothetical protein
MVKLGAVAVGAYVLGRLKKGRTAVGFAMWLAGARMDPKRMLRDGLVQALRTPEAQQLLTQVRGPMLEAGRRAATATVESQVAALTQALQQRTQMLTAGAGEAAEKGGEAADEAAEKGTEAAGKVTEKAGRPSGGDAEEPNIAEDRGQDDDRGEDDRGEDDRGEDEGEAAQEPEPNVAEERDQDTGKSEKGDEKPEKGSGKRSAPKGRAPRRPRKEGARA